MRMDCVRLPGKSARSLSNFDRPVGESVGTAPIFVGSRPIEPRRVGESSKNFPRAAKFSPRPSKTDSRPVAESLSRHPATVCRDPT